MDLSDKLNAAARGIKDFGESLAAEVAYPVRPPQQGGKADQDLDPSARPSAPQRANDVAPDVPVMPDEASAAGPAPEPEPTPKPAPEPHDVPRPNDVPPRHTHG